MPDKELSKTTGMVFTKNRLEALVDGIFGFSLTLLVVNLSIPRGADLSELGKLLIGQLNGFFAYAISFLLLATFWIAHHRQFHYIRHTDIRHIWINILMLLFVAFMPFSTSLLANYAGTLSDIIFGGNLMVLGMLLTANWIYATDKYRLVEQELDRNIIIRGIRRTFVTIGVAALAMVISIFYPVQSSFIYLLILLLFLTPPFRNR
jgi:uncharacterized membrane protein